MPAKINAKRHAAALRIATSFLKLERRVRALGDALAINLAKDTHAALADAAPAPSIWRAGRLPRSCCRNNQPTERNRDV